MPAASGLIYKRLTGPTGGLPSHVRLQGLFYSSVIRFHNLLQNAAWGRAEASGGRVLNFGGLSKVWGSKY